MDPTSCSIEPLVLFSSAKLQSQSIDESHEEPCRHPSTVVFCLVETHERRCYLTLTQALHLRMGGNPFGPAGTGKTESVKALGAQLGRFVLVFNCDESFDYSAMGRLFAGLCQVQHLLCVASCGRTSGMICVIFFRCGAFVRDDRLDLEGLC